MQAHVVVDGVIVDTIETPSLSVFGMELIPVEPGIIVGDDAPIEEAQPEEGGQ